MFVLGASPLPDTGFFNIFFYSVSHLFILLIASLEA